MISVYKLQTAKLRESLYPAVINVYKLKTAKLRESL